MTIKRKKFQSSVEDLQEQQQHFYLAQKELGDVVLVDIPQLENPTKGKALDMLRSKPSSRI